MDAAHENKNSDFRCGIVALAGRSNVGKSTLLNHLVGRKIAAVTPRPQTTRRRILGVRNEPDAQLVLVDMPGFHDLAKPMNQRMLALARRCLSEADIAVTLVEGGQKLHPRDREILAQTRSFAGPRIVAINKIDLFPRSAIIPVADECARVAEEAEIVPISALTGENVGKLVEVIKERLPRNPPLYPPRSPDTASEQAVAEEIILEKIFLLMRDEVPFSTAVKIEEFSYRDGGRVFYIRAVIVVERESHKGMIIGAGGARIKEIGRLARQELELIFNARGFLELFVRVEENWTRDSRKLAEFHVGTAS